MRNIERLSQKANEESEVDMQLDGPMITFPRCDGQGALLGKMVEEDMVKLKAEFNELSYKLDTILEKLVQISKILTDRPVEQPSSLVSYGDIVETVIDGIQQAHRKGLKEVPFELIVENLIASGIVIPNKSELRQVLRDQDSICYDRKKDAFWHVGEDEL